MICVELYGQQIMFAVRGIETIFLPHPDHSLFILLSREMPIGDIPPFDNDLYQLIYTHQIALVIAVISYILVSC